MHREEYNIEFVGDDFSVSSTGCCPICGYEMCFLPVFKVRLTKEHRRLVDELEGTGVELDKIHKLRILEWNCDNCKTIYINIKK